MKIKHLAATAVTALALMHQPVFAQTTPGASGATGLGVGGLTTTTIVVATVVVGGVIVGASSGGKTAVGTTGTSGTAP